MMSRMQKILKDPAVWTLLLVNLFFIYKYGNDPQQYTTVLWLYWCQSVLIGILNFFDMLTAKNVTIAGFKIDGHQATPKQAKVKLVRQVSPRQVEISQAIPPIHG